MSCNKAFIKDPKDVFGSLIHLEVLERRHIQKGHETPCPCLMHLFLSYICNCNSVHNKIVSRYILSCRYRVETTSHVTWACLKLSQSQNKQIRIWHRGLNSRILSEIMGPLSRKIHTWTHHSITYYKWSNLKPCKWNLPCQHFCISVCPPLTS